LEEKDDFLLILSRVEIHRLQKRSGIDVNSGETEKLSAVSLSLMGINTGLDLVDSQRNTTRHTIQNDPEMAKDWQVLRIFILLISQNVLIKSLIVLMIVLIDDRYGVCDDVRSFGHVVCLFVCLPHALESNAVRNNVP
jgi:hypothetical protein